MDLIDVVGGLQVAKELAPSVIYIDEIDKVWLTSKSKKNASDIVKMKACIMQHKNQLKQANRVLVVGNSQAPFSDKVDRKDLNKFFGFKNNGKMLFLPCPGPLAIAVAIRTVFSLHELGARVIANVILQE